MNHNKKNMSIPFKFKLCDVKIILNRNITDDYIRTKMNKNGISNSNKTKEESDNLMVKPNIKHEEEINKDTKINFMHMECNNTIKPETLEIELETVIESVPNDILHNQHTLIEEETKHEVLLVENNYTEVTDEVVDDKPIPIYNVIDFEDNEYFPCNENTLRTESGINSIGKEEISILVSDIEEKDPELMDIENNTGDEIQILKQNKTDYMIKMYCTECGEVTDPLRGEHNEYLRNCLKCSTKMHFKCSKCGKLNFKVSNMRVHATKVCYPLRYYQCNYCDFKTKTNSNLRYHTSRKHPHTTQTFKTKVVTDEMKKMFCMKCNVTVDMVRGKGNAFLKNCPKCCEKMSFTCSKCGRIFTKLNNIGRHVMTVCYAGFIYKCDFCNFWTAKKTKLYIHLNEAHPPLPSQTRKKAAIDDIIKMRCEECNILSNIKRGIYNKYLRDCPQCSAEMNFICPKCGKEFSTISGIKFHVMDVCYSEKYYKCDICSSNFALKSNLLRHINEHHPAAQLFTGDKHKAVKTYSCSICDYKTQQKCNIELHVLNEHQKVELTTYCYKCGKAFKDKLRMDQHLLTCNLRFYKCIYCSESWAHSKSIKHHLREFHREEIGEDNVTDIYNQIFIRAIEAKVAARKMFYAKAIMSKSQ